MKNKKINFFFLLFFTMFSLSENISAACGNIDRTWTGGNGGNGNGNYWSQTQSWSGNNIPNSANENAIIPSSGIGYLWVFNGNQTVGCVDVTSGLFAFWTFNLTVLGDYFRANSAPDSIFIGQPTGRITMAGTEPQTLEVVDTLPNLTLTNNTSVTFTDSFSINNAPVMSGATTTLYIDNNLQIVNNSNWTIPAGNTVHLRNGRISTAGNITVNGTLIMDGGTSISMSNGRTLSINNDGLLRIDGFSGSPASIETGVGNTFNLNVTGDINAEFFRFSGLSATGLNVSGDIQRLQFGEFHNIPNGGYGLTLGGGSTIPSTMEGLGFFNELGSAAGNINTSAYSGPTSTIDNWLGDIGGETNDLDTGCGADPPGCVSWGTEAATSLTITDVTAAGSPPATIGANSADTLFATYAFALTRTDTVTNITNITITQNGSASQSEVDEVMIFQDNNNNCVYNAGTDSQIGVGVFLTGNPLKASFSIPTGVINPSGTSPVCLHLVSSTTNIADRGNTIQFEVSSTLDVTNSQGYAFSSSSGPPVTSSITRITGGFEAEWTGNTSTNPQTNSNWFLNIQPNATTSCTIGPGERVPIMTANITCANATLPSGGELNFNNANRTLDIRGSLEVEAGYNFSNTNNATLALNGSTNQGLNLGQAFPNNLTINNSGVPGNDNVFVVGNSEVEGDVTVSNGTLSIGGNTSLTIGGDLIIQSGAELEIAPGGTLILSSGSSLTINNGATFTMVGTPAQNSFLTSTSPTDSYVVNVSGNISAQHYSISRLGTTGLTINASATIDPANNLSNGSFSFPVNNNSDMLRMFTAFPGNAVSNLNFDLSGSTATGTNNIFTDAGIGAGTATITTFSGSFGGSTFDDDNTYLLNWVGETNSLDLSTQTTTPAIIASGSIVNMGRWGFEQSLPGASFADTDITSLKVTMTGTGNTGDVDQISLFYDDDCDGNGNPLGAIAPTGVPGTATFTIGAGQATIPQDDTTTEQRCLYVEYQISSSATDGRTLGAQISIENDISNSENYVFSGGSTFPASLGAAGVIAGSDLTIWTGATNSNWFTASNWTSGVPDSETSCQIPNTANDPIINGIAICNNVDIDGGFVTFQNGTNSDLEIFGSLENTGTINQNDGSIIIRDDGATGVEQLISSSSIINAITFNKTAGNVVRLGAGSNLRILDLDFPAGQNFEFNIPSNRELELNNGLTIPNGITFSVSGGGTLEIGANQNINVTGGTFRTNGVNDAFGQFGQPTSNKAHITRVGSGRWGFNATSGNVDLQGFWIEYLDVNGLRINGTANLSQFDGGQFSNLLTDFSTPVRALVLNTTTAITETTASNIGFTWGAANASYSANPAPSDDYFLVHANNCNSQTLTFSQWFGDFWGTIPNPDTEDKIFDDADGGNCFISIDAGASPVSITQMTATAYDSAVDLVWTTGAELNHAGFNIYRSIDVNNGFVQINSELIKNVYNTSAAVGDYLFRDETVVNGQKYYYYIEDLAHNGATTMHGPLSATPLGSLSAPPPQGTVAGADQISDNPADSGVVGQATIAPGVTILSQSGNTFRIEILADTLTTAPAGFNASFFELAIPHYSKTLTEGSPELLQRTILIPVDDESSSISANLIDLNQATDQMIQIAPAPTYSINSTSGLLEANFNIDSTVYGTNANINAGFYTVENQTKKIAGKNYIMINVMPVNYNPVTDNVMKMDRVVLEVFTDGVPYSTPDNEVVNELSLYNAANTVKVAVDHSGMYELSYDELRDRHLEGPFVGLDISDLRFYYQNRELPIQVNSADSIFNSGDSILVFLRSADSIEDRYSYGVLSPRDLIGQLAKRIETVSAPVDASIGSSFDSFATVSFEENNNITFDEPFGGHVDHFFWDRILISPTDPVGSVPMRNFSIDLPNHHAESTQSTTITLQLRTRGTDFNVSPNHAVKIHLNGDANVAVTNTFLSQGLIQTSFTVASSSLQDGINSLDIEVVADDLGPDDYSIIDIDKISIDYPRAHYLSSGSFIEINNPSVNENTALLIDGVEPAIYDTSSMAQVKRIIGHDFSIGSQNILTFKAPRNVIVENGAPIGISGTNFWIGHDGSYLSFVELSLNDAFATPIRDSSLQADYIMIGIDSTLPVSHALAEHRSTQGLNVSLINVQQIYNEFSYGRRSTQAIKDFVLFARDNWQNPKPKYLLFIGDSSVDPLNFGGFANRDNLLPTRIIHGDYEDFASDAWFVSDEVSENIFVPFMAQGRIPSNDIVVITDYINKMIDYENGDMLSDVAANQVSFFNDQSLDSENFISLSSNISNTAQSSFTQLSSVTFNREDTTDADFKLQLLDQFNNEPPLVLTLNGHGASDLWADFNIFNTEDAEGLSNTSLPIVLGLNCTSGYTQAADPEEISLGEALAFNPSSGAIAFWGSTSLTPPNVQSSLANYFFSSLGSRVANNDQQTRLGDHILIAKNSLPQVSGNKDALLSFNLIGDPALQFPDNVFIFDQTPIFGIGDRGDEGARASGGCTINKYHNTPWYLSLIEIFLLVMIYVLFRQKFILKNVRSYSKKRK